MRLRPSIPISCLFCLAACSAPPGLSPREQGRAMAETILDKPACRPFAERMTAPAIDAATLNAVYREAVAAHCLKPTV